MTTFLTQEFAFWLVVLFTLALALGVGQFAAWLVWRQRSRPARLPAPEDDDPDTAATLDELLRIAEARAPAAAVLRSIEAKLYHG